MSIADGAVVMHPRYKLDYFRKNQWPEEWIETVRVMARSHYAKYYKPSAGPGHTPPTVCAMYYILHCTSG